MTEPPQVGDELAGKYRVDRVLGEGAMGVVLAATDQSLDRKVAIKVLQPIFAADPAASARFFREARTAAKIKSEHVCRVLDVAKLEDGAPYMVMELLEGLDLGEVLEQRGGRLEPHEVAAYVIEACEAIAEAHAIGIVHRDLKPANLFLATRADGSPSVKVLDFGISKAPPGSQGVELTAPGSAMGSPLYMSPEQMRAADAVDARSDVWGLGAIMYELLTGSPPFPGETLPEVAAMVLTSDAAPVSSSRPELDANLSAIVARCLQRDVSQRYEDVGELACDLARYAPAQMQISVERILKTLSVGLTGNLLGERAPMTHRAASATGMGSRISALPSTGPERAVFKSGLSAAAVDSAVSNPGATQLLDGTGASSPGAAAQSTPGTMSPVATPAPSKSKAGWVLAAMALLLLLAGATAVAVTVAGGEAAETAAPAAQPTPPPSAAAEAANEPAPTTVEPTIAEPETATPTSATPEAAPAKRPPSRPRPAAPKPAAPKPAKPGLDDFGGRK